MIRIENLNKSFKKSNINALKNISFNVERGESVALLGENGAGKTTLIRIISTILRPDSGTCLINDFCSVSEPLKVRRNIGILQGGETGLYDRLTAYENIEYFGQLHGIGRETIRKRIKQFAEILEMDDFLNRRCGTFSKGMKQKTAIARSLIHNPEIIILDEPTSGLDISASKKVQDFIHFIKGKGKSILFSSHDIQEIIKISDRIIIMHKGTIIDSGKRKDLENRYSKDIESIFHSLTGRKNEY